MADYLRFRDDQPADEPAVSLDAFFDQPDACSVRIEAGDDPERLIPHLGRVKLVEVDFPKFRDGRGFSTARVLREAGYDGEIKATGDVLVDLVFFMRRCGFDSFAPNVAIDPDVLEGALSREHLLELRRRVRAGELGGQGGQGTVVLGEPVDGRGLTGGHG